MFRKIITFLCVFILMAGISTDVIKADTASGITLIINNKKIESDVSPLIINDRTMVPVRVLFEHLNAEVRWDGTLKQVIVTSGSKVMIFEINSTLALVNSNRITLDSAPVIVNDRALVPVRFISEHLGYNVDWNATHRTVYIYGNPDKNTDKQDNIPPSVPDNEPVKKDEENNDNKSPSTSYEADNSVKDEEKIEYTENISSVVVSEKASSISITLNITGTIKPEIKTYRNPYRLIFDFKNVYQKCADGKKTPNDGYPVNEVRWARHAGYSRVVIEAEKSFKYTADYTSSGKYVITVTKEKKITVESSDKVNSDKKPIVVIDAGHGGRDSGAVGRNSDGDIVIYEKTVNLKIATRVSSLLKKSGVEVIMTRSKDVSLADTTMADLLKRCEIANEAGADLFVSVHNNAFTDPTSTGTCVLYAGLSTNEDYGISGKQLAQNILNPLVKATGLKNKGLIESPNIVVLKKTEMPAALIECAFVTNENDRKILLDDDKLDDIAQAVHDGIMVSLKQMNLKN